MATTVMLCGESVEVELSDRDMMQFLNGRHSCMKNKTMYVEREFIEKKVETERAREKIGMKGTTYYSTLHEVLEELYMQAKKDRN
jgi:hypothetical protein